MNPIKRCQFIEHVQGSSQGYHNISKVFCFNRHDYYDEQLHELAGTGGDVQDGSYRMEGDFGTTHDNPKLNDSVMEYTQIRIGGGASWKIGPAVTVELEAGVVPLQEFDYHRADVKARSTDIPPYGGVVLKAAF